MAEKIRKAVSDALKREKRITMAELREMIRRPLSEEIKKKKYRLRGRSSETAKAHRG
eukprot:TRINITY_DN3024_c0_g2_i1.p5 TRINITY_DN3024_c0_g2~~TRINITY_DN3024_c0_g2_i1.p5  ORF type:complete len:57 (+),score=39.62 TRINITY_DN3024_c0_g2_i1:544-714(+)